MIELFFWLTPNGMKPLIFLHEVGLEYELTAVDINKGDQFTQEFLEIAPNGRIPAIIDHAPAASETAVSVFESGAILIYLAEKTGHLLPQSEKGRTEVLEWVMWQRAWADAGSESSFQCLCIPEGALRNQAVQR